jgi:hypothetical protein
MHWQTKGFARHNAYGGIYDALDDLIDRYVEVAMGKAGRFVLDETTGTLSLKNLKDIKIIEHVQSIKAELMNFTNDLDGTKDTDLLNIRDEMLAEVNKLAYLLTLE